MKIDEYKELSFCDNCKKETIHLFHSEGHERDSSHDYTLCLTCNKKEFSCETL